MKPESQETENNFSDDLKTFEELPAMTQELLLLGDGAGKTTGRARIDIESQIDPLSGLAK